MKKIFFLIFLAVLIGTGCNSEEKAWKERNEKEALEYARTGNITTSESNEVQISGMSPEDQKRIREIILNVLQDPDYLNETVHKEFWDIINNNNLAGQEMEKFRDLMTGELITYNQLFYQDALIALQTGKPYKSPEREEYESRLYQLHIMTAARIVKNDDLMEKISKKEPITNQNGDTFIMDETLINTTLDNIATLKERVDRLFTP